MPRHLSAALDELARWPRLDAGVYGDDAARCDETLASYLTCISLAQVAGLAIEPEHADKIATLWRSRPDLRGVLAPLVENLVFEVLLRPFVRWHVATSRGDVQRWVAHYPALVPALTAHHQRLLRRFNDADTVVRSTIILVRYLGASPDSWRAAALALKRRERVHRKRLHGFDDLRHDLEDHGALTADEAAVLNEHLLSIDAAPLEHTAGPHRWHARPASRARLLGHIATASRVWCPREWGERDVAIYTAALSALPATELADFARAVAGDPILRAMHERVLATS